MNPESAEPGISFDNHSVSIEPSRSGTVEHAASAAPLPSRLIEAIVETPPLAKPSPTRSRLDRFLAAPTVRESLEEWFGGPVDMPKDRLLRRLNRDVAFVDQLLNDQINGILHAPAFQRLESTWRGLHYLVDRASDEGDASIKVKFLTVTWKELERDFEHAVEFDQSQLFKKVYEQEFGMPGGEPFGAMIADYEVHPRLSAEHPHDDIRVLTYLAETAAAAFCPLITNASPAMFGMDGFEQLEHTLDHARTFSQAHYLKWHGLRQREDARFLGLTLPRVLMRLPYVDDGKRIDRFQFHEDVTGPDHRKYLWGGAAFAVGEVLIRAFAQAGWMADIRGVRRGEEGGGLVTGLPVHSFVTDKQGVAVKSSTDVIVTDQLERQPSELGFVPLCHCHDTDFSAFYSNQSVQKPKTYDRAAATVNARISSMLQYMFCAARFAHYIKVIGRDKVGSFTEPGELENYIHRWITKYVTSDSEAKPDVKARRPLREAKVGVSAIPGKPGSFQCIMHLAPHYELDEISASVKLTTELTPRTSS